MRRRSGGSGGTAVTEGLLPRVSVAVSARCQIASQRAADLHTHLAEASPDACLPALPALAGSLNNISFNAPGRLALIASKKAEKRSCLDMVPIEHEALGRNDPLRN